MSSNTPTMGATSSSGSNASLMMSAGSMLQTGASAYAAYTSGRIEQSMMKAKAMQAELQAKREKLKGEQASNIIREQLLQNLASTNVLFAGAGVNVGTGTSRQAVFENRRRAMEDINQVQINAESAADASAAQAQEFLTAGKIAKRGGTMGALQTLGSKDSREAMSSLLGGFSGESKKATTPRGTRGN